MAIMKHTYIYKGSAYKRTPKNIALKQIEENIERKFFLVGSNVNQFHFHGGWFLAMPPTCFREVVDNDNPYIHDTGIESVKRYYNNFAYYLERELGRYPVFYIEVID